MDINIRKIIICLFIIIGHCVIYSQNITAEEIPVLKNVQIKSSIDLNKANKIYSYSYEISNPSTNTGQIRNIQIDISKPEYGIDLSMEGFIIQEGIDAEGIMLTISFEEEIKNMGSRLQKAVLPIGIQVPLGWSGGISVMSTASWGARKKNCLIVPSQSLSGFVIISYGLPSIRDITVKPKWVFVTEGYVTQEDLEKSKKIEEEITFKGKTIGPTAPPADFKPLDFLNNIINMKHEATSLGWIKDKGIEQSLDAKLDNAKKKIEEGNNTAAKNILEAFVNEVEAQNGKHLTSEAYGLLKYNVQYLMEKL